MFVNCSNHPSTNWSEAQFDAAGKIIKSENIKTAFEIVDYPFPNVDPEMDEDELDVLAERTAEEIIALSPDAVMCQGEYTLTYRLVNLLKKNEIIVVSACSERRVVEKSREDGSTVKEALFSFVRFRRY